MEDKDYVEDDELELSGSDVESEGSNDSGVDPDSALIAPIQAVLKGQLLQTLEKSELELREKREAVKKAAKERESEGVALYAEQQQLALAQLLLERQHENYLVFQRARTEADAALDKASDIYKTKKSDIAAKTSALEQLRSDLNRLASTSRQLEQYNEEVAGQIAVTRRATYKAEEAATGLEKQKEKQDDILERQQQQIRDSNEQYALIDAQVIAQEEEAAAAAETVKEAGREMDAVVLVKNQLMQEWQSSLVGLQRRDNALKATQDDIMKTRDHLTSLEGEMRGHRSLVKQEQDRNEKATEILNKAQNESISLKKQVDSSRNNTEASLNKYNVLVKSIGETEDALNASESECHLLNNELASLTKQNDGVVLQINATREKTLLALQSQETLNKGSKVTSKQLQKVRAEREIAESEMKKVENDAARVVLQHYNVDDENAAKSARLQELLADLKEKETVVDRYEVELRRRTLEIEKKQAEVDRLNRKYDKLVSNMHDESTGPLEATIHNLSKSLNSKREEASNLQQYWLRAQNEMVQLTKESGSVQEEVQSLKGRHLILQQRRTRLTEELDKIKAKAGEHERHIRRLHAQQSNINTLIAQNTTKQTNLAEANLTLETTFLSKLHDGEATAHKLEERVVALKLEKAELNDKVDEANKQAAVWEKKIQLARETAAALDPNVGTAEIRGMQKEIHRMKLRYSQLQRHQDQLASEMEKAILKRESIGNKGRTKTRSKTLTKANLEKNVRDLNKTIKQTQGKTREMESQIQELDSTQEEVASKVEEVHGTTEELRTEVDRLESHIQMASLQRMKALEMITLYQKLAKRWQAVLEGKLAATPEAKVLKESDKESVRTSSLQEVLHKAQEQIPPVHASLLNVVEEMFTTKL